MLEEKLINGVSYLSKSQSKLLRYNSYKGLFELCECSGKTFTNLIVVKSSPVFSDIIFGLDLSTLEEIW